MPIQYRDISLNEHVLKYHPHELIILQFFKAPRLLVLFKESALHILNDTQNIKSDLPLLSLRIF